MKKKTDKQKIAELEKKCYDLRVKNNHLKDRIMSLEESNRCLISQRDFYKKSNDGNCEERRKERDRAIEAEYNLIQMQLRVNSLVDKICKIK